jgi:cold shock CspA family protein
MAQGTVKEFDPRSSTGVVLMDDRSEVAVEPASIEGSEVRYLRLGQRVDFRVDEREGRRVARDLHLVTFSR